MSESASDTNPVCNACQLHIPAGKADIDLISQARTFKRCSACKGVWYCNPECQKQDWVRHIFHCNSNQTITTAHHLALAVHDNSLPKDEQTLADYGFTKAFTDEAKLELLGLYSDLIKRMEISPKTLDRWRAQGYLLQETKEAFEKLSAASRGSHYLWFLKNEYILGTSIPDYQPESQAPVKKQRTCNACGDPGGITKSDEDDNWDFNFKTQFEALKRCAGCKKVWYCSPQCQKQDWIRHIFDCNPRQPVTTAHHLALAVHDNLLPDDEQTCIDYGFKKAFTAEARSKLLGVYIGLIERMEISPKTIRKWRIEGRLLQEIKNAFEKLPPASRGGYYPWLLQNEYILDSSAPDPRGDPIDDIMSRGLKWAGIAIPSSLAQMRELVSKLPEGEQQCLYFCTKLLSRWHPAPFDAPDYVTFGFCACTSEEEEGLLGDRWHSLLRQCSFEDICSAYDSASFLALFRSKGIEIEKSAIIDVLKGSPHRFKSVWRLKQFVLGTDDSQVRPINSVWADYGFMYCGTDADRLDLKAIYKAVFKAADPIQLHEACISGKLLEFVGRYYRIKDKKREKYARLLKNMYPLSDI